MECRDNLVNRELLSRANPANQGQMECRDNPANRERVNPDSRASPDPTASLE